MPHFSLCYCEQLLSVKMAPLTADNQNLLKSLLQSPCAHWCTNSYYSTYKPHETTYSSFPDLPNVFMTWSFTSRFHRLFSLLGMTFPPSFLSSWKDLMFLPRLKSSVMSPMRDLPDKIICLFLRGTIASEQTSFPYSQGSGCSLFCLRIFPQYCQSVVTGLTADAHDVSWMCMCEQIPKPRLADTWCHHIHCWAKAKMKLWNSSWQQSCYFILFHWKFLFFCCYSWWNHIGAIIPSWVNSKG